MFIRKKSTYSAAVYLRLSRDDGDKAESDSIQNQRELIRDFITNHPEIETSKEFVDDGYSGTNFERPGFIRMMRDCQRPFPSRQKLHRDRQVPGAHFPNARGTGSCNQRQL